MDFNTIYEILKNSKNVFLLEPPYVRKYPPLGLAKISSLVKKHGGTIQYGRKYLKGNYDAVCITSLFTYDVQKVIKCINQVQKHSPGIPIFIGGIAASLIPTYFYEKTGIYPYIGYSEELDGYVPDYSIDWMLDKRWSNFSFTFTSRGCTNTCAYCAVKHLEPNAWINPTWFDHVNVEKPYAMISDNNILSTPEQHQQMVFNALTKLKKFVLFDNGFDCKRVNSENANLLSSIRFIRQGLRLAFDRIEEDGVFQNAVLKLIQVGIPKYKLLAYVLFNFNDTPQEANYRMTECLRLGIKPYPQVYRVLNSKDRNTKFIGRYWTKNLVGAFRYFWLMAGIHEKCTFDKWLFEQSIFKLDRTDYDVWHSHIAL